MNIKTIVKVMNFHAILRVDKAHKAADKIARLEREVTHMIDVIQNNRNLILDKWVLVPNEKGKRLQIYIGSDLGFCGAVNASVNAIMEKEGADNVKIIIGRKLHKASNTILQMAVDEFNDRYSEIEAILYEGIRMRKYSGIDLIYDHYHNMTHIEPTKRTIFPIVVDRDDNETYREDFSVEGGDLNSLMEELIVTYINYEIKGAAINSYASENILRENATNESLKRIDEMEQEELWQERRIKNELSARKVIDSFIKTRYKENKGS